MIRFSMRQQFAARKAKYILVCITRSVISRLKVILPLCSHEAPTGVLCPVPEPPAQEEHGIVGMVPGEGHEDNQSDRAPPLQGQAERAGAFSLQKTNVQADLIVA